MMERIKQFIQRLLPSSKSQINDRFDRLNISLDSRINSLEEAISSLKKDNIALKERVNNFQDVSVAKLEDLEKKIGLLIDGVQGIKERADEINKKADGIKNKEEETRKNVNLVKRKADESIWAVTWHDTIQESEWLKNQTFSPGRWAIGYQYLYVLYRVLNEFRPASILELGLGQSTRMISQYVEYNKETRHIVTEHDAEWEQFYIQNNPVCERTVIEHLDLSKEPFDDDKEVMVYKDFTDKFQNNIFDFISIDAPFGGRAIKYARIDVLKIMPHCLGERFVIMVDDYNRPGEKEMVKELYKILDENGIEYSSGIYSGAKDCILIASKKYKFLCSM